MVRWWQRIYHFALVRRARNDKPSVTTSPPHYLTKIPIHWRVPSMSTDAIVRLRSVHKIFTRGSERIDVLKGLNLEVGNSEFLGLMGPSGSGKTTLLNLIAGLDKPSEGEVWIGNFQVSRMSEAQLARWRTRHIGFIFQFYHLLP